MQLTAGIQTGLSPRVSLASRAATSCCFRGCQTASSDVLRRAFACPATARGSTAASPVCAPCTVSMRSRPGRGCKAKLPGGKHSQDNGMCSGLSSWLQFRDLFPVVKYLERRRGRIVSVKQLFYCFQHVVPPFSRVLLAKSSARRESNFNMVSLRSRLKAPLNGKLAAVTRLAAMRSTLDGTFVTSHVTFRCGSTEKDSLGNQNDCTTWRLGFGFQERAFRPNYGLSARNMEAQQLFVLLEFQELIIGRIPKQCTGRVKYGG